MMRCIVLYCIVYWWKSLFVELMNDWLTFVYFEMNENREHQYSWNCIQFMLFSIWCILKAVKFFDSISLYKCLQHVANRTRKKKNMYFVKKLAYMVVPSFCFLIYCIIISLPKKLHVRVNRLSFESFNHWRHEWVYDWEEYFKILHFLRSEYSTFQKRYYW
jgi:hypothetical protein